MILTTSTVTEKEEEKKEWCSTCRTAWIQAPTMSSTTQQRITREREMLS